MVIPRIRSFAARSFFLSLASTALLAAAPAAAADLFGTAPVANAALGKIAGREDSGQTAFSNHTTSVANSSVGAGTQTGEISITDAAFQNLTGLSAININTGNNVAVNSALNVNIAIITAQ